MEINIMENGRMVRRMAKEIFNVLMAKNSMANGEMINN